MYTRPRHEKKVQSELTEINIKSFLPIKKQLRFYHDRNKIIDTPLFPSYVFIYLDKVESYYRSMDISGALYYVRTGKEIAIVSESVINNIKLVADQAKDFELSDKRFVPGRKVIIIKGALAGLCCEVVEFNNKQKLLVRVEFLQRNLLLTVSPEVVKEIYEFTDLERPKF